VPQRASAGRIELKPTQERVLAELKENGSTPLTRGRYEEIAGVSRSQAAYDLVELVEAGILERIGNGRATRYRLAHKDQPGQRRWTNERIRSALDDFCTGRGTWPSASEFKAAGHSDLYVAASRYGGVGFWAAELGFTRPARATAPRAQRRSWWPRVRWAAGGAALAGALVAAAAAAIFVWPDSPVRDAGAPQALHASSAGKSHKSAPARASATAPKHKVAPTKAKPARTRKRQVETSTPAYQTQLAAQRVSVSPSTHYISSTPKQESATPQTSSSTPAPMAPPPRGGSGGPAPLPPPHP